MENRRWGVKRAHGPSLFPEAGASSFQARRNYPPVSPPNFTSHAGNLNDVPPNPTPAAGSLNGDAPSLSDDAFSVSVDALEPHLRLGSLNDDAAERLR